MLEFRLALRLLRKQPVVTLTTLIALTIGIGMATTGFTLLDSVLYSRLPYPNGDRFVLFNAYTEHAQRTAIDAERFRFFVDHASSFEHLGAFQGTSVNLVLPSGEIVPVSGATLTPGSIGVFPYTPVLGRTLRADDSRPGDAPVALIRESLWRRHFSSDPGVIGTMTTMSGSSTRSARRRKPAGCSIRETSSSGPCRLRSSTSRSWTSSSAAPTPSGGA